MSSDNPTAQPEKKKIKARFNGKKYNVYFQANTLKVGKVLKEPYASIKSVAPAEGDEMCINLLMKDGDIKTLSFKSPESYDEFSEQIQQKLTEQLKEEDIQPEDTTDPKTQKIEETTISKSVLFKKESIVPAEGQDIKSALSSDKPIAVASSTELNVDPSSISGDHNTPEKLRGFYNGKKYKIHFKEEIVKIGRALSLEFAKINAISVVESKAILKIDGGDDIEISFKLQEDVKRFESEMLEKLQDVVRENEPEKVVESEDKSTDKLMKLLEEVADEVDDGGMISKIDDDEPAPAPISEKDEKDEIITNSDDVVSSEMKTKEKMKGYYMNKKYNVRFLEKVFKMGKVLVVEYGKVNAVAVQETKAVLQVDGSGEVVVSFKAEEDVKKFESELVERLKDTVEMKEDVKPSPAVVNEEKVDPVLVVEKKEDAGGKMEKLKGYYNGKKYNVRFREKELKLGKALTLEYSKINAIAVDVNKAVLEVSGMGKVEVSFKEEKEVKAFETRLVGYLAATVPEVAVEENVPDAVPEENSSVVEQIKPAEIEFSEEREEEEPAPVVVSKKEDLVVEKPETIVEKGGEATEKLKGYYNGKKYNVRFRETVLKIGKVLVLEYSKVNAIAVNENVVVLEVSGMDEIEISFKEEIDAKKFETKLVGFLAATEPEIEVTEPDPVVVFEEVELVDEEKSVEKPVEMAIKNAKEGERPKLKGYYNSKKYNVRFLENELKMGKVLALEYSKINAIAVQDEKCAVLKVDGGEDVEVSFKDDESVKQFKTTLVEKLHGVDHAGKNEEKAPVSAQVEEPVVPVAKEKVEVEEKIVEKKSENPKLKCYYENKKYNANFKADELKIGKVLIMKYLQIKEVQVAGEAAIVKLDDGEKILTFKEKTDVVNFKETLMTFVNNNKKKKENELETKQVDPIPDPVMIIPAPAVIQKVEPVKAAPIVMKQQPSGSRIVVKGYYKNKKYNVHLKEDMIKVGKVCKIEYKRIGGVDVDGKNVNLKTDSETIQIVLRGDDGKKVFVDRLREKLDNPNSITVRSSVKVPVVEPIKVEEPKKVVEAKKVEKSTKSKVVVKGYYKNKKYNVHLTKDLLKVGKVVRLEYPTIQGVNIDGKNVVMKIKNGWDVQIVLREDGGVFTFVDGLRGKLKNPNCITFQSSVNVPVENTGVVEKNSSVDPGLKAYEERQLSKKAHREKIRLMRASKQNNQQQQPAVSAPNVIVAKNDEKLRCFFKGKKYKIRFKDDVLKIGSVLTLDYKRIKRVNTNIKISVLNLDDGTDVHINFVSKEDCFTFQNQLKFYQLKGSVGAETTPEVNDLDDDDVLILDPPITKVDPPIAKVDNSFEELRKLENESMQNKQEIERAKEKSEKMKRTTKEVERKIAAMKEDVELGKQKLKEFDISIEGTQKMLAVRKKELLAMVEERGKVELQIYEKSCELEILNEKLKLDPKRDMKLKTIRSYVNKARRFMKLFEEEIGSVDLEQNEDSRDPGTGPLKCFYEGKKYNLHFKTGFLKIGKVKKVEYSKVQSVSVIGKLVDVNVIGGEDFSIKFKEDETCKEFEKRINQLTSKHGVAQPEVQMIDFSPPPAVVFEVPSPSVVPQSDLQTSAISEKLSLKVRYQGKKYNVHFRGSEKLLKIGKVLKLEYSEILSFEVNGQSILVHDAKKSHHELIFKEDESVKKFVEEISKIVQLNNKKKEEEPKPKPVPKRVESLKKLTVKARYQGKKYNIHFKKNERLLKIGKVAKIDYSQIRSAFTNGKSVTVHCANNNKHELLFKDDEALWNFEIEVSKIAQENKAKEAPPAKVSAPHAPASESSIKANPEKMKCYYNYKKYNVRFKEKEIKIGKAIKLEYNKVKDVRGSKKKAILKVIGEDDIEVSFIEEENCSKFVEIISSKVEDDVTEDTDSGSDESDSESLSSDELEVELEDELEDLISLSISSPVTDTDTETKQLKCYYEKKKYNVRFKENVVKVGKVLSLDYSNIQTVIVDKKLVTMDVEGKEKDIVLEFKQENDAQEFEELVMKKTFWSEDSLFSQADTSKSGYVTSQEAVKFFPRFGLSNFDLGVIWKRTQQNGRLTLDGFKKYLIKVHKKTQQLENTYFVPTNKRKEYEKMFTQGAKGQAYLTGMVAKEILVKFKLDVNVLKDIWALSDSTNTGKLYLEDFIFAMNLVERKRKNLSFEIPKTRLKYIVKTPPYLMTEEPKIPSTQLPPPMMPTGLGNNDDILKPMNIPSEDAINSAFSGNIGGGSSMMAPNMVNTASPGRQVHSMMEMGFSMSGMSSNAMSHPTVRANTTRVNQGKLEQERLRKEQMAYKAQMTIINNQVENLRIEEEELVKTINKQRVELQETKNKKMEFDEAINTLKVTIDMRNREKETYKYSLQQLQQEMLRIQPLKEDLERNVEQIKDEVELISKELENEIEIYNNNNDEMMANREKIKEIETEYEKNRTELEDKRRETNLMLSEKLKTDEEMHRVSSNITKLEIEKEEFQKHVEYYENEIGEIKSEKSELDEKLETMQSEMKTVQDRYGAFSENKITIELMKSFVTRAQEYVKMFNEKVSSDETFAEIVTKVEPVPVESKIKSPVKKKKSKKKKSKKKKRKKEPKSLGDVNFDDLLDQQEDDKSKNTTAVPDTDEEEEVEVKQDPFFDDPFFAPQPEPKQSESESESEPEALVLDPPSVKETEKKDDFGDDDFFNGGFGGKTETDTNVAVPVEEKKTVDDAAKKDDGFGFFDDDDFAGEKDKTPVAEKVVEPAKEEEPPVKPVKSEGKSKKKKKSKRSRKKKKRGKKKKSSKSAKVVPAEKDSPATTTRKKENDPKSVQSPPKKELPLPPPKKNIESDPKNDGFGDDFGDDPFSEATKKVEESKKKKSGSGGEFDDFGDDWGNEKIEKKVNWDQDFDDFGDWN